MIGKRFAHYDILEKLGSGGMGEVYRAHDLSLGREVAVKVLPVRFAGDPDRLQRFEQEARAASSLNHPNIVTIHEVGEAAGLPYIVMERVRGQLLRTLLGGQPLPQRQAVDIAAQTAEGLAKAHAAGIVHRDLKPENLMFTEDGFVKILDFGLAKLRASRPEAAEPGSQTPADGDTQSMDFSCSFTGGSPGSPPETAAGVVLGTAGYMSPEQAQGRTVDFRSDQFSLGAILYEMVSGQRAFERPTPVQTLAAIIDEPPAPLPASVPAPLRRVTERCLSKDPSARYDSTLDLARELREILTRLPERQVRSRSATPPNVMTRRRRRLILALVGTLALGGIVWGFALRRSGWSGLLPAPRLPAQKQVVVLPFETAGDPGAEAFAAGLTETLSLRLTQIEPADGSLWVVPASDVQEAGIKGPEAAGKALGANLALQGRLLKTGDRARLTLNLLDTGTLRSLRSLSEEGRSTDSARWQESLVDRVAGLLEIEVGPQARQALRSADTRVAGAYAVYLQGRGELQRYENPERIDRALEFFQKALQQDPGYALAYAGMAEAHWRRYELSHTADSVELAQKACRRALEINDLLAPVHVTQGVVLRGTGKAEEAAKSFERALALDPGNADALRGLSGAYQDLGRYVEAEASYRRAIERRPGYWGGHNRLGVLLLRRGRYPEAEAEFLEALELSPDNVRTHNNLGGLYGLMGRYEEAARVLERSTAIRPSADAYSNLGTAQFFAARYAQAARALERAVALEPNDFRLWRNLGAAYYWAPGERDRAGQAYQRALALGEERQAVNPKDPQILVELADCQAMLDHAGPARRLALQALALAPVDATVLFKAGEVYEQIGDREAAVGSIGKALRNGYSRSELERNPGLAGLRADARLRSLQAGGS